MELLKYAKRIQIRLEATKRIKFSTESAHWRVGQIGLRIFLLISLVAGAIIPGQSSFAAGAITGTVFRDLNANGSFENATEPGVAGVTITAYDAAGANQGSEFG